MLERNDGRKTHNIKWLPLGSWVDVVVAGDGSLEVHQTVKFSPLLCMFETVYNKKFKIYLNQSADIYH